MSIDKSKKVFVLDFDNHLYDLLKEEYNIVKHSNLMEDVLTCKSKYDFLLTDSVFQDGDIIELAKVINKKPYCLEKVTPLIQKELAKKVYFISINDLLPNEEYIDISSKLQGYKLTIKVVKLLIEDKELIGDLLTLYSKIGSVSSVEKSIRYYKERLFDDSVLESDSIKFNKKYPTNTEFFRLLLKLYTAKKIKVD